MAALTIDASQLRKTYGTRAAVRDLTLQVAHGEAVGFLGPNGAGKSTSIKMLLGLVKLTGGRALLLGKPVGTAYRSASPYWLSSRTLPLRRLAFRV